MTQHGKSFMLKKEDCNPSWFLLDAKGKTLGRLASEIAKVLRGKHRPTFTPHIDGGDGVIVINASSVKVTGNKAAQKVYRRHTGYPGGLRETPYRVMMERKPCYPIRRAVEGMMPKTRLGRQQIKKLRIYAGDEHGHEAQKPVAVEI